MPSTYCRLMHWLFEAYYEGTTCLFPSINSMIDKSSCQTNKRSHSLFSKWLRFFRQFMVFFMYPCRNDLCYFEDMCWLQTKVSTHTAEFVLEVSSVRKDNEVVFVCYALECSLIWRNCVALCTLCWRSEELWTTVCTGLVTCVHIFERNDLLLTLRCATTTLCRNWCEGVLRWVV